MNLLSVTGMTVLNNFTAAYGTEAVLTAAAFWVLSRFYARLRQEA